MVSEARNKAQLKYNKAHTTQVTLRLNRRTDADVIELLEGLDNKQGYIKALIRADIQRAKDYDFLMKLLEEEE